MFKLLFRKLHYFIYNECRHEGPVIVHGFVAPENKRNHTTVPIQGFWKIRQCNFCKELYARPADCLDPTSVPPFDFKFAVYKNKKGETNVQPTRVSNDRTRIHST